MPVHKQQCYKSYNQISCPVAEKIQKEILSIPISSVLTDEQVETIICALNRYNPSL
ncbi:MAG: DegT/DnrJ/EryC1/StrS family aminotransferase [Bacteroides sp.]|nr:DegT/DnrJ/EryC1/StrS family aminotransferase [Bacteroides sp.]